MTNKLLKDLLIIEVETTGPDSEKDPIIQLSGLLLDKDNLLEKGIFNTYVRTSLLEGTLKKQSEHLGISFEVMQKSPKPMDAAKKFAEFASVSCTLTLQHVKNLMYLKTMFKKAGYLFPYEQQIFQLWSLEYMYSLKIGFNKLPTLQTLVDYFKLQVKNPYNALERARLEAEVLRRIIN